jgi:hypothetical protein
MNKFHKQLLYVQHCKETKDTTSTISQQSIREYFLRSDIKIFSDSNFSEYLKTPKANLGILKSYLNDRIIMNAFYCNPLPFRFGSDVITIHAFVVFQTQSLRGNKKMWWSLEKSSRYIFLQQSPDKDVVTQQMYEHEKKEHLRRKEPVKPIEIAGGNQISLCHLFHRIRESDYHLLNSNSLDFASFIFEMITSQPKNWSTKISALVERLDGLRNEKTKPTIRNPTDFIKYIWIQKDVEFAYYMAMIIRGKKQDFEELAKNNLTTEMLNSVDSQGYTLLEWATVFSTSDWPIDQFLKEKGAETPADKKLFRRNMFFIALQYLPSYNKELINKCRYLLSFDGIDIHGVNRTDDTALHLALYGKKWDVAEKILTAFPDYDVNATNSLGETALHLALQLHVNLTC